MTDERTRLLRLRQAQAQAADPPARFPLMSQLNTGIAETLDAVNPGNAARAGLNRLFGTDLPTDLSVRDVMADAGIETTDRAPEGLVQGFMRGSGQAAASAPFVAAGLQALTGAGGMVGQFADDALRVLGSKLGTAGEVFAGGVSGASREGAEMLGFGETGQDVAALVAPLSVPAVASLLKAATVYGPTGTIVRNMEKQLAPFTAKGAKGVATERMQGLAGGSERAEQLASRIDGENPLGLTPAQQTQDSSMLGIEALAAQQDPELREYLALHRASAAQNVQSEIQGMGGDVEDAQAFFAERRRQFAQNMQSRVDAALGQSGDAVQGVDATRPDGVNSRTAFDQITARLDDELSKEKELWLAIDRNHRVGTAQAKEVAQRLIDETAFAQRSDIPRAVQDLLDSPEVYGDGASVRDMHGLYSELRRVARSAMAGNDQNKNTARIANEVADAILKDLGAVDGATAVGRQINEARAFSAALHETYDRGAPGRLLKRTLDGDQAIDPELSLRRTVGRQGTEAAVASQQIEAAGVSPRVVQDYLAGQFAEVATNQGTGEITLAGARRWMARNKELLKRYPELRNEIESAVAKRESAEGMAARVHSRIKALEDTRQSATARFVGGQAEKAYQAITEAQNPVRAARKIANEARKDPSGKALDGLKGALADHLINSSLRTAGAETAMDATSLNRVLETPQLKRAMSQIFSEAEMARMRFLAKELAKSQSRDAANVGDSLSGADAPRWIQIAARIAGAKVATGAANARNAGVSLQAANIGSNRMRDLVQSLTADRASQMIADAVRDPKLFKALLTQTGSVQASERALPKFIPYLIGGATTETPQ